MKLCVGIGALSFSAAEAAVGRQQAGRKALQRRGAPGLPCGGFTSLAWSVAARRSASPPPLSCATAGPRRPLPPPPPPPDPIRACFILRRARHFTPHSPCLRNRVRLVCRSACGLHTCDCLAAVLVTA